MEAFFRSVEMTDRVIVVDNLTGGTVYKARPNAATQHVYDAQVETAEYLAQRWNLYSMTIKLQMGLEMSVVQSTTRRIGTDDISQ